MSLSNYPPGVTGNEIQISGPSWEGEVERQCDGTDVSLLVYGEEAMSIVSEIKILAERGYAGNPTWLPKMQELLDSIVQGCFVVEGIDCPFIDGEVYAWARSGVLHWTCPVCGKEHEEDGP